MDDSPQGAQLDSIRLMQLDVMRCTTQWLLDTLILRMDQGLGAWVLTANMDFLSRARRNPAIADLYRQADIVVADGMPLVWASRLQGRPLPGRIT